MGRRILSRMAFNNFQPLTVFAKSSIVDVCLGSEYAFAHLSFYSFLRDSYILIKGTLVQILKSPSMFVFK